MARIDAADPPAGAAQAPPSLPAASIDDELVMHLERDQLVAATSQPVAPATLGGRTRAALWALRVFVVLVGIMVIYTFIARLH